MATGTKAKPAILVLEFGVDKDTPNAKRFKQDEPEDGSRPEIGSIYLTKKALMPMGNTSRIRVTVEAIGGNG